LSGFIWPFDGIPKNPISPFVCALPPALRRTPRGTLR
jgi:hypothetical protein